MKKHPRIVAGEIQLPEEMIQHIQSFLTAKEAAQTTILSKSWYAAWLTRPNLEFFETDVPIQFSRAFLRSAEKTVRRFDESNRRIESFRLRIRALPIIDDSCNISLANEMIAKALKLGATEIDVEIGGQTDSDFVIPYEALESENLVRLSLVGTRIDPQGGKVNRSRLESLRLSREIGGNKIGVMI